ncbi:LacI family DNA-binding transcriptional regulator [Pararhodobacter zhoushanensis]|uniref:LacI family transcriptional regulator n=1 Tax=Pararhodobacter zhoushanensis TaxID=2479545 RepID=A0ABT3H516_9RHOB|nr:LacI family DNA-binding transcriptional regulator [Pararhodobacter zhoushanensis]MCW1934891.1 LacI family transcriptional regulator [Pararhodobacter zhoushanensis]
MQKKRATIKDVASLAGVSTATVSHVVNGSKPVKQSVHDRVIAAARQLDYHADRAASQLRSGQTKVVAILVPDLDDAFFTSLVSRLEVMAGKDGFDVIVASSRDDPAVEQSRLRALLGWRPAGMVVVPCTDSLPSVLIEECRRTPVVLADRVVPAGAPADTVTIDNAEAGEIAARHLVAMGHRDVVIAASNLAIAPIRERERGARDFLRAATGRAPVTIELGSNSITGAERFAHWQERHARPTAVLALTNVTTLAVLSALAQARVDIPEQVSVIGFDDYAWMSARKTALTAIRQPLDVMAQSVWDRLTTRMGGETGAPVAISLTASLQVRDSVLGLPALGGGEGATPGSDPLNPGEGKSAIH